MKRIILSLAIIAAAGAIVIGATTAYFSDTEVSEDNTISAGIIDLTFESSETLPFAIGDIKPGYDKEVTKIVRVTDNPSNVWLKLTNFSTDTGIQTDAECKAEGGDWRPVAKKCENMNEKNDLHNQIYYDLKVCVDKNTDGNLDGGCDTSWVIIYSFDEEDLELLSGLKNKWIPLKMNLNPDHQLIITQSFHFDEEAGNKYQGDVLTFDEEFVAYQAEATSPTGNVLYMENKDPDTWKPIKDDGIGGELTYNSSGENFEYTFKAWGLTNGDYDLIYYADKWPGEKSKCIGTFTVTDGTITELNGSKNLGIDLPTSDDANYPAGAKIWLVLAGDYDNTDEKMTGWNPDSYLFENDPVLIHYDDTDVY